MTVPVDVWLRDLFRSHTCRIKWAVLDDILSSWAGIYGQPTITRGLLSLQDGGMIVTEGTDFVWPAQESLAVSDLEHTLVDLYARLAEVD